MMTTPEEKFNQQVWEILQNIKEEILATEKGKPVKYRFGHFVGVGIIPKERKKNILYKLQELGAIRIRENPFELPYSTEDIFYLDIKQPKFDEIYEKFRKACDVSSYLNDYQQKVFQGNTKLPKFSQLDTTVKEKVKQATSKRLVDFSKKLTIYEKNSKILLPDSVIGHLLCVYLKLYEPENGVYNIHISLSDSSGFTWNPWKVYQKKDIWSIKVTLGQRITSLITELKSVLRAAAQQAVPPTASGNSSTSQLKQTLQFVEELLQKYEPYQSPISDSDLKKINEHEQLRDTVVLVISIIKKQYEKLCSFLEEYQSLYSKKGLEGQQNYYLPEVYANEILQEINKTEYVERYGYNNLVIRNNHQKPNFCHSLMYLVFRNKIKLRRLIINNNSVEVNLDNLSRNVMPKGQIDTNSTAFPNWHDDFEWKGKQFVFGKYGSTNTFNSPTRQALFNMLTKAKGNWVTVKELVEVTGKNEGYVRPTIGQIKRAMKSELRKFIDIPSTNEDNLPPKPQGGAYRIKFTPKSL